MQRSLASCSLYVLMPSLPVWRAISNDLKFTVSGFFFEKFDVLIGNVFSFDAPGHRLPILTQRFYFKSRLVMNVVKIARGAARSKQRCE